MDFKELAKKVHSVRYIDHSMDDFTNITKALRELIVDGDTIICNLTELIVIYEYLNDVQINLNISNIKISDKELTKISDRYDRFNIYLMLRNSNYYLMRLKDMEFVYNELVNYSRLHKIKKLKREL